MTTMSEITVRLTQVPGATQEFVLNSGATVADLLQVAGKDAGNYAIRINGATGSTSTVLGDNATVLLSKNAVGNS
jgi:sulfur carrier protein ThiS